MKTLEKQIQEKRTLLKKITDKQRYQSKKSQITKIKQSLSKLTNFKSRCYVCRVKTSKRGFTFHHKFYIENDIVRKDYQKNEIGTLQYYTDLEPLIRKDPTRFLYLCNPHHQAVTRLARWKGENKKRLLQAVEMTK